MRINTIDNQSNKLSYLIIAHILILLGYTFNRGNFSHQAQLWLLLLGWLFLFFIFLKKKIFELKFDFNSSSLKLLLLANLVSFILFYFLDGGVNLAFGQQISSFLFYLKLISLLLFFLYFVRVIFSRKNLFI